MEARLNKIRSLFSSLIIAVVLTACEMGSSNFDPTAFNDSAGAGLAGVNVPEELISYYDGSVTVQAARNGVQLWKTLIDTAFSCYDHKTLDYSQPYFTFGVSGNSYYSDQGNGVIDYDPPYGDFTFVGGPLEGDDNVYVSFDEHGQHFDIDVGSRELGCFQHGSSLERGFHRFLLNTPELGDYTCQHTNSDDQQIVRLSSEGVYSTAQGTGRYTYSNIVDYLGSSDIEFSGGPLDGESVSYREDPDTGRQEFRISETQTFGIAVGASSSLTYVCGRLRTARPFKQYGYAESSPVAQPAVALTGLYFSPDIYTSSDSSYMHADYYNFRADGYLRRQHPNAIGDDCNRTQPNGLNYCESYNVVGDRLKIYSRGGQEVSDKRISFGNNGLPNSISGDYVELVTPIPATHIEGIWSNNSFSSSGCIGLYTTCTYSYSQTSYRFEQDGRFIRARDGFGGTSAETPLSSINAFGSSSNDSTGYYEVRGNRLILWYANGDFSNLFIHQSSRHLAIGSLYFVN